MEIDAALTLTAHLTSLLIYEGSYHDQQYEKKIAFSLYAANTYQFISCMLCQSAPLRTAQNVGSALNIYSRFLMHTKCIINCSLAIDMGGDTSSI